MRPQHYASRLHLKTEASTYIIAAAYLKAKGAITVVAATKGLRSRLMAAIATVGFAEGLHEDITAALLCTLESRTLNTSAVHHKT